MAIVYKITRADGLEYVGITTKNLNRRVIEHAKTKRFEIGISESMILLETDTYEEAEFMEEHFIEVYDTYHKGLNLTPDGKGKNKDTKFNTFGYKFSDESREKMSKNHRLKRGFPPPMLNKKHTQETKQKWSNIRRGKCWGPKKLSKENVQTILYAYNNDTINFSISFISEQVKKTQRDLVGILPFEELISPNGKPLVKRTLYGKHFASVFGVTSKCIGQIIDGRRVTEYE